MEPILSALSLGIIGIGSALGGGAPLIPALMCGSVSSILGYNQGQCPAQLDDVIVEAGKTQLGARTGELVMSEASDYSMELLGDSFCEAHAYSVLGTTLGMGIGQNTLCLTTCEQLPQVAIMSGFEGCKQCCKEATIAGLGRAVELLPDMI